MKRNNRLQAAALLLPLVFALASCGNIYDLLGRGSSYDTGSIYVPPVTSEGYYTEDNATPFTYKDIMQSTGLDALPSTGSYTVLVLPIEFTDFRFTEQEISDLEIVLNAEDGTGYWESLHSYYYESSYGQLDVHFELAPVYDSGMTSETAYRRYAVNSSSDFGTTLVNSALAEYKKDHSTKSLDTDSNGNIDGVIGVYSCPDYESGELPFNDAAGFFWAYTYWAMEAPSSVSPTLNLYFFMSIDFIYSESGGLDCHTLAHEFGHMLGLDDYYPTDYNPAPYDTYFATGWLQMMDGNILDHDPFSKVALGWIDPIVVLDDCTIEIESSATSPNAIIVPTASWNGTAFDEYLVIDLYTPEGLNYLDSHETYLGRPRGYTREGIRVYHVDARLVEINVNSNGNYSYEYYSGTKLNPSPTRGYSVAATNSQKSNAYADIDYSLLNLIDKESALSLSNPFFDNGAADNDSLFYAGDTFALSRYMNFFPERTVMNNGYSLEFTFTVNSIKDGKAVITFEKN